MNKKIYYAKLKAILSLQFWFNKKTDSLNLLVTRNKGGKNKLGNNNFNLYRFGGMFAKSKLLDKKDHHAMVSFCEAYIKQRREYVEKNYYS